MVDRSNIEKAIIIADRGYESFNNLAHIQEKGFFFLFRIKDGRCGIKSGLDLPQKEEFDVFFELNITRKQTNEVKKLCQDRNSYKYIPSDARFDYLQLKNRKAEVTVFYKLSFRIVRFKLSNNSYEVIITNLNKDEYPPARLKELYSSRWGIETSFRELKYTLGMLNFHTKKTICIYQEIYAHIIMYNFVSVITSHVIIDKNKCKYKYKANFSAAVHICRAFLKGNATSSDLEAVIANNIHPVRPDRHYVRIHTGKHSHGFTYRVA